MEISQVLDQMQGYGLPLPPHGHLVLDGKVHRFGTGKLKSKCWYSLREISLHSGERLIGGAFGIWHGTDNGAIKVKIDWSGVTQEERAQAEKKQREIEAEEAAKKLRMAELAANRARMQWESAEGGMIESNYLQRKKITPEFVRCMLDGTLLVPVKKYSLGPEGTRLVGVQKITSDGEKRFNYGMDKIGSACLLGSIDAEHQLIAVCEGYATGRSVRMALESQSDMPVMVAFDAGNLKAVAKSLRDDFPDKHILFLADDDWRIVGRFIDWLCEDFLIETDESIIDGLDHILVTGDAKKANLRATRLKDAFGIEYIEAHIAIDRLNVTRRFENAGLSNANAAAAAVGDALVISPKFKSQNGKYLTDFNDLHVEESLSAVRQQIESSLLSYINSPSPSASSPPCDDIPVIESPAPSIDAKPADNVDLFGAAAPAGGEGKKKAKKVYSQAHWDAVNHLLDNFRLVYGTDAVWDEKERMTMKVNALRLAYTSDAVKFWLNNGDRKVVRLDHVVFDPSCTSDPETTVNLYDGTDVKHKKGDCSLIIDLLRHLVGGDAVVMAWILRWIAYQLRNQGAKMASAVVMHGDEGSGKNVFWELIVCKLFGKYGCVIGQAQIESQFNEWASAKLFFVADEVITRQELRQMKGKIKYLITGEKIMINTKNISERTEVNHSNFVFLSNELQPLALDRTDRRYLVVWTPPKQSKAYYDRVITQVENGGLEAFYYYLLHEVDMADFNRYTDPPNTVAKENLITLGLSAPERFYREWSGGFLPLPYVCCSSDQLYQAFLRWCHLEGERFMPSKTIFTPTVERAGSPDICRKVVKCELGSEVKQRTMFMIGEKPQDKTQQVWLENASGCFEESLKKYRRGANSAEM